jgi:flagellin
MVTSVNGNALTALQARENALAGRASGSGTTQSTDTSTANRDAAVVYAGSSGAPSLSSLLSVQDSLNRAAGVSDVGVSAGQTISGLLGQLRDKAQAAQGAGPDQQASLNADYQQVLGAIDQVAGSASFQGVNILDGSSGDLQFKADATGDSTLTVAGQDFTTGGPVLGLAGTSLQGSPDDVAGVLGQVDTASQALAGQLSQMNAQSAQIQGHLTVVGQLQSALTGQGATDLDADGARLQALMAQQTLAGQGSGMANQAPQALLALFRNGG